MTRVVIVGEIYNADLSVGGGPMPGGPGWGGPVDPGYGRPGWRPVDPGYGQGGSEHPGNRPPGTEHPGNRPPGSWGGPIDPGYGQGGNYPSHQPVPGGGHPSQPIYHPDKPTPPGELPQGGTEVPPEEFSPPRPPEDISSQIIVSVYDPSTMEWTTKSYPPPQQ